MIFCDRWWPMKPLTPRMRMRFTERGAAWGREIVPCGPCASGERQRGPGEAGRERRGGGAATVELEVVDAQRAAAAAARDEDVRCRAAGRGARIALHRKRRCSRRRPGVEEPRAQNARRNACDRRERAGIGWGDGAHQV